MARGGWLFMGRRPRVEYEGAFYHVIQRGNNREFIYLTPQYRDFMVKQLRNAVEVDGVEMFAYVIMSNHYHLLIRTSGEPLQKVMHRMNTRYAKWYNSERERTGPVFEGRYKAILIQNEPYLLQVARYIHRNPVRAKLCDHPGEYPWSSDGYYRENKTDNKFVNSSFILSMLASNYQEAMTEYNILVDTPGDENFEDLASLGNEDLALIAEPKKAVPFKKSLDQILIDVGVDREQYRLIKSGSRKRMLQTYKLDYIQEAIKQGYTFEAIGKNIGLSASGVGKCMERINGNKHQAN
jgi:putative transposase